MERRIVRAGLWHHITQDDEDAAQTRLKRHYYGNLTMRRKPEGRKQAPRVELSDDARFAAAVIGAARRQGYQGDPFHVVMREFPEWTRERWGRAVEELENARLGRLGLSRRSD